MPFFLPKRKSKKKAAMSGVIPSSTPEATTASSENASSLAPITVNKEPSSSSSSSSTRHSSTTKPSKSDKHRDQQKLVFHCQLAHGSPTGLISGFSNVKELYQKIADCFEIPVSTILFCTLNTHKIDMNKLLGAQLGLEDFIFVHVKGQTKEIDVIKSEMALGLTITDNGAGYCFIKQIKEGSVIDRIKDLIKAGDHVEKINEKSVVGLRHFQVAQMLKDIPVGSKLKMRLIEPNAFGFQIEPPKRGRKTGDLKSGTKTLRFKADGAATIEEVDDTMVKTIERINGLLETYMGINDSDLAQQIWDFAENKKNPSDFALAIDESEIGAFNFTDDFIFDLWAAIGDIKAGRIAEEEKEVRCIVEEDEADFETERL